jgi:phosphoadenosine phosphosulfate reductase
MSLGPGLIMNADQLARWNQELQDRPAQEVVQWAVEQSNNSILVSTNFRPYEAVLLHMATVAKPDIVVLWVDHGYNRPATYRHAEQLRKQLGLNLHGYVPKISPAHRDAIHGPIPSPDDEPGLKTFSAVMKLEPFQRGMRELAPKVWLTALRKVQNPNRAELNVVSADSNFGTIKVSPLFHWSDADLEAYLAKHGLPNEWDYFDPAKAEDKRECGLHAAWGGAAATSASGISASESR